MCCHCTCSHSSSSLVSLIELFITIFTKVVYHTARRDEVTQQVNLRLIPFEQTPPFSFEPPWGSLYGQWRLTEPVVRVKRFSCCSCSFKEARGVADRWNQRGRQAAHLLPQLFWCILATACCSILKRLKCRNTGIMGFAWPSIIYVLKLLTVVCHTV